MGPQQGARATEIAAVRVRGGRIVGHYQSLMNGGVAIPPFIEGLTGITNAMVRAAPPAEQVMREALDFCGDSPMVAHNANFDRGFWVAEAARAGVALDPVPPFACTVLLGRRVFDEAPSHRLSRLADWCGVARDGRAHRALSDATVTAHLWLRMVECVAQRYAAELEGQDVDHALMAHLQNLPRGQLAQGLRRWASGRARARVPTLS